ncbi:parasitic phase-specific protein psp-1 protein [Colletotrichum incanum]|uniref:Parasitic phase-specific protein psp-1 protein n=1 Tax=Colletotrichum incanum TaxID=1573173 RepID=A0A162NHQ4_COLIC|nr:parasitic phase-specific protein psp-1 protein [Colletotrichum incanum]
MGCMVFGAMNAVLGYAGRIVMYYNPFNFAAFMVQISKRTLNSKFFHLNATLADYELSISLYYQRPSLLFGGYLYYTCRSYFSPSLSRFHPNLFYGIFIPCDVVCPIFQAVGGALSKASAGTSEIGVDMALFTGYRNGGILRFFADYLIRYSRAGSTERFDIRCKLFFGFMALAIILILVRCSYRLVKLRNGYRGDLIRDEPIFIALEGVMVLSAVLCLMISHPGFVFKNNAKEDDTESTTRGYEEHESPSIISSRI